MQDKVNHSLCAASMSGNKMQGQQDPVMKTNPYPYAGNNPVNFVDPLGLDYTYWDRPFADTFCKNTVSEDCNKACAMVHAWTDCFPISTPVYYRFVTDDSFYGVKYYNPGECHECWTGYCYSER